MSRIFHASDLHFGAEDREALEWFAQRVAEEMPDAVVITGDVTMRARHREFAAAAEWLSALSAPVTVEVGNHDLPYFNLVERFARPYRRYRQMANMVEREIALADTSIVPLKTTARAQLRANWSKGRVGRRSLARALGLVDAAPQDRLTLIACHHPLLDADTRTSGSTHGGRRAIQALARAGADAVLSGHVHDPFDLPVEAGGRIIRMVGAGTLSERIRATPPSFNELRVEGGQLEVIVRSA